MSKIEILERRIQIYKRELRKLRLQLKIAKIEQEPVRDGNRSEPESQVGQRRESPHVG
jgi:hypothetical protein